MPAKLLSGRRSRLKSATESHHRRLDGLNKELAMFGSISSYEKYLTATLASRVELEAILEASQIDALVPNWTRRKIVPQLLEDVRDLGGNNVMSPAVVNASVSMPAILGTLYVVEGSGLGAGILINRAAKLGLSGSLGARHLAQQVYNLRSWRTILNIIETTWIDDEDCCNQAAIAAFGVFESNYRRLFGNAG
ncbi:MULTISPECIES: biliverdin-producing heme oxygenase [unclassified Rhizobium]|jgi:heme oxygenase|uniref:biliverdin-producing heme oxygenase n=1 Tax=unclassified Rhizobium TaxID=2613769 RepID=UPI0011C4180E|nr:MULTISPECIES: biliverdin-producing heme oxygenase [unclassified Rhizobium]MBN8954191.1 biliverdin-producing heme oxygenase [Rhizobium tropici]